MRRATRFLCFLTVLACVVAVRGAPAPTSSATLIVTGGTVVTMDAAQRVLSPGAVAIRGTDIVAVGPTSGDPKGQPERHGH